MHSKKLNEIQATWFEITSQLALTNNRTLIYDMGTTNIQVTGVTSRPTSDENSKYRVYITYLQRNQGSYVGKVLYADLLDETGKNNRLYDFTDTLTKFAGNSVKRSMLGLRVEEDHFYYSGSTNYVQAFDKFENDAIDWTSTAYQYGFLAMFTSDEHCNTVE